MIPEHNYDARVLVSALSVRQSDLNAALLFYVRPACCTSSSNWQRLDGRVFVCDRVCGVGGTDSVEAFLTIVSQPFWHRDCTLYPTKLSPLANPLGTSQSTTFRDKHSLAIKPFNTSVSKFITKAIYHVVMIVKVRLWKNLIKKQFYWVQSTEILECHVSIITVFFKCSNKGKGYPIMCEGKRRGPGIA